MISAYSGVADAFAGAGPGALAALRAASARPAGLEAANEPYPELDVERDEAHGALWCYLRPAGPPSFTPGVLRDLHALHARIRAELAQPGRPRLRYYVQASRLPGIFNMGGDFQLMGECVRSGDRARLRAYAHACVEAAHAVQTGFDAGVIGIALVQGEALGGGFEAALACGILVAERGSTFGLPEIRFNAFPGMGAYSFLARKIGVVETERMILSGAVHSAEAMYEAGVVDVLAEPGRGRAAVEAFMAAGRRTFPVRSALARARERVAPVTLDELRDVTDLWVENALQLAPADLRRIALLRAAQMRRLAAG